MKNKSTYSLILEAETEEKSRSLFETGVYALVLLCMAVSGWHFASASANPPKKSPQRETPSSMIAGAPVEQPPVDVTRG